MVAGRMGAWLLEGAGRERAVAVIRGTWGPLMGVLVLSVEADNKDSGGEEVREPLLVLLPLVLMLGNMRAWLLERIRQGKAVAVISNRRGLLRGAPVLSVGNGAQWWWRRKVREPLLLLLLVVVVVLVGRTGRHYGREQPRALGGFTRLSLCYQYRLAHKGGGGEWVSATSSCCRSQRGKAGVPLLLSQLLLLPLLLTPSSSVKERCLRDQWCGYQRAQGIGKQQQ